MDIIRSIIAALFILLAIGIFSRYTTARRLGLLLGAATYGTAGVLCLVLGAWWPLLAGFAGAWLFRLAGAEPPTDLRLDLPTIERAEASNDARVREYLRWWLANDVQVRLVTSRFVREAWQRGLRRPVSVPDDESWAAPDAVEAWLRETTGDIRSLATASRHDFRDHLDRIVTLSTQTLMVAGEATVRYDLPSNPPDFDVAAKKITSATELTAYAENCVADAVLSARLRVLAWTYQYWHGERYELPHKRSAGALALYEELEDIGMITTGEIIGLLVERVADTPTVDLVKECGDLGMRQIPYQDVGLASNLPPFEAGYHFRFNPDGKEEALFEILEKDGLVLQVGYQLALPASLFFSKASKRHRQLKEILETHYGIGQPMNVGGIEIINYGNHRTIAYISRFKVAGIDAITVRVGNRRFWD